MSTLIQNFKKMQYAVKEIISPLDKRKTRTIENTWTIEKTRTIEKTLEDKYSLLVRVKSSEGYIKVPGLCV